MAFNTHGSAGQEDGKERPVIDFDAINQDIVETAGLQERETLVGYISQVVDLGTQELPDAENTFTGTAEDEAKIIAEQPDTYFKDGFDYETKKAVRLKCYPQKPQPCVAFAVDFPEIIVDKGKFFGDSSPLPLRLWLGGKFYTEGSGMVVGRPTPLKFTNLDKSRQTKVWSLAQNSLPYKMAVGAKIIKNGEAFLPERVDELIGKSLQFAAQVYFKESKGKQYYTEYVNFVGALGRGQKEAEQLTTPYVVEFTKENPEEAIRNLSSHVVNTMKRASNFEGSAIQKQIEAFRGSKASATPAAETPKPEAKAKGKGNKAQPVPEPAPDYDSFDDDTPF